MLALGWARPLAGHGQRSQAPKLESARVAAYQHRRYNARARATSSASYSSYTNQSDGEDPLRAGHLITGAEVAEARSRVDEGEALMVGEEFVDSYLRAVGMGVPACEARLRELVENDIVLIPDKLISTQSRLQGLEELLSDLNTQHQEYRRVHFHRLASALGRPTHAHNGWRAPVYVLCDYRMQDVGGLAGHPATFRISRGHCLFKLEVGSSGRVVRGWIRRQMTQEERESHVRDYVHMYPAPFPSDHLHLCQNEPPRRAVMEAAARTWVMAHATPPGTRASGYPWPTVTGSAPVSSAPAGSAPVSSAPADSAPSCSASVSSSSSSSGGSTTSAVQTASCNIETAPGPTRTRLARRRRGRGDAAASSIYAPHEQQHLNEGMGLLGMHDAGRFDWMGSYSGESSVEESDEEEEQAEDFVKTGPGAGLPTSLRRLLPALSPTCRLLDAYGVHPSPLPGAEPAASDLGLGNSALTRRAVMGSDAIVRMLQGAQGRYDIEPRVMGIAACEDHNLAFVHYGLRMRPKPQPQQPVAAVDSGAAGRASAVSSLDGASSAVGASASPLPAPAAHVSPGQGRVMYASSSGSAVPPSEQAGNAQQQQQQQAQDAIAAAAAQATAAAMAAQAAAAQAQELLGSAVSLTSALAGNLLTQVQESPLLNDAYSKAQQTVSRLRNLAAQADGVSSSALQGAHTTASAAAAAADAAERTERERLRRIGNGVVDIQADGSFTVDVMGALLFDDEGAVVDVWVLRGPTDVEARLYRSPGSAARSVAT